MDFASVLAERVQSVLPDGFTVRAEEGSVRVSHGDDWGTSTGVDEIMGADRERAASAASALLNSVQDYVSEELKEPWPSMAVPEAAVEGSVLHMWFGERDHPTLAVSDIDLTELQ